jgi:hypothetical protein
MTESYLENDSKTMTIHIQSPGLFDRLLALIGKRRAVFIGNMDAQYGYYIARRENFVRALIRPQDKEPPEGWVYCDEAFINMVGK